MYTMFADHPIMGALSALDEAVINYIEVSGTVSHKVEGRIVIRGEDTRRFPRQKIMIP